MLGCRECFRKRLRTGRHWCWDGDKRSVWLHSMGRDKGHMWHPLRRLTAHVCAKALHLRRIDI